MQLTSGITPIPFTDNAKIVLHLIPIESLNPEYKVNINSVDITKLGPIYGMGWNHRINLEGILSYTGNEIPHAFAQLYRNGIIESVEGLILRQTELGKLIPSYAYEEKLMEACSSYLNLLKELCVNTPIIIFLTLLGVKDYEMGFNSSGRFDERYKIDRDILQLPETIVETFDIQSKEILRPMFDVVWNACGIERSLNFDKDGNWIKR